MLPNRATHYNLIINSNVRSYVHTQNSASGHYFFNPFQFTVVFHIETSHLTCKANQMVGFFMKCSVELKWVKETAVILDDYWKLKHNELF